MHEDSRQGSHTRVWLASRSPLRVWMATAALATGLALAGCGGGSSGPGVASTGTSTTSSGKPAASGSGSGSALAYSRCMREHGIKDFPDPNSNGQIQLSAGPGSDLLPTNPQFNTAQQACKSLMPGPGTPAQQRKDFAAALKLSHCMRAHGVPKFPDPSPPSSGPQTQSQSGSGGNSAGTNGVDPNSPQFKSAFQACKSLAPGGGMVVNHAGPGA